MTMLPESAWLRAPSTRKVMAALEGARPGGARFVGGCVRNALLGEPVSDIDIATQLTPDRVEAVLKGAGCAVHLTGVEHGTVTVVADGAVFEVTTLRRDVETDGRRAVVAFTEDWLEDAHRRDFTINALYADQNGVVFDPTGSGLRDIDDRSIVFVGDAETRIREDYLRILRFFRFLAWYGHGEPDAEGLAACAAHADGLAGISAERIWSELKKLLRAATPDMVLERMVASGVASRILPFAPDIEVLARVREAEQSEGLAPDPLLRLAALAVGASDTLKEVARAMKVSNDERARLLGPGRIEDPVTAASDDRAIRQAAYRHGGRALVDLLWLRRAEEPGNAAGWNARLNALRGWEAPTLPVRGADIAAAGVQEGPRIGEIVRKLEDEWVASDFSLSRDRLLVRAGELAADD